MGSWLVDGVGPLRERYLLFQVHPNQQSKFTAITYEGEGAQEAWEDDFRQFSRASRTGLFQLFGISQSEVPMLIFHHELIPVAHFYTKSLWMDIYMDYLLVNEGCREEDLWMDTRRGILCSGPTGPHVSFPLLPKDDTALQALPSTLDMLEEGNSVAFFSKFGSNVDRGVLACAWEFRERTYLDNLFPKTTEDHQHEDNSRSQLTTDHPYLWRNSPHDLPIDIGGLHFDTVYSSSLEPVARWPPEAPGLWMLSDVNGLVEETRIDGGLTRFQLVRQGEEVRLDTKFDWERFWRGWLSQSSRVFDFPKMTGRQESFSVVDPPERLELRSIRHEYEAYDGLSVFFDLCDAVEEIQPIYFFLYPPPMTISELMSWMGGHTHFWSFDEDGRSKIPKGEWERWNIPILTLSVLYDPEGLVSWSSNIYSALCKWQIARGFDPSTADWARECGYPEFKIIRKRPESSWRNVYGVRFLIWILALVLVDSCL